MSPSSTNWTTSTNSYCILDFTHEITVWVLSIHTKVILGKEWSMYSSYKPHYTKFTLNVPNKSIWYKVVVSCYPQNLEENNNPFNEYCYMKQTNKLHYKYVETNKVWQNNVNNLYFILFISTTYGYKWKLHFGELNDFHFCHCLLSSKQWIASYYCTIVSEIRKTILFKMFMTCLQFYRWFYINFWYQAW